MIARPQRALRLGLVWVATGVPSLIGCASGGAAQRGAGAHAPRHPPSFACVLPCLQTRVDEGTILAVEPADPGLQYRFLSKLNNLPWDWTAAWQDDATFMFRPHFPGEYALQVDVRDRTTREIVWRKWLGEIEVHGPLVRDVGRLPPAHCLPIGTSIEFMVQVADVPLDWLEFRTWDLVPTNTVVTDWQRWPLPPYVCEVARRTALQVDVRMIDAPQIVERFWLGDVISYEQERGAGANLLRNLASDDFEIFDSAAALTILAGELWLATHMLIWEFDGVPIDEQLAFLRQACQVRHVQADSGGLCVTLAPGRSYDLGLSTRTLAQTGSPVALTIDLARFSRYAQALRRLDGLPRSARPIALLTQAIYEGFRYGTPPGHFLGSVADVCSHCGTQSQLLQDVLDAWDIESDVVALTVPVSSGPPLFHALVQVRLEDQPLLLDPSAGYLYACGADALAEFAVPDPIVLPQCRDLSQLDLRLLTSFDMEIAVAPRGVPGVVPLSVTVPSGPALDHGVDPEAAPQP